MYVLELPKNHGLNQRIEVLENESVMAQTIAQENENFWAEINEFMTEILPSIAIIFEQEEFVHKSKEVIEGINETRVRSQVKLLP